MCHKRTYCGHTCQLTSWFDGGHQLECTHDSTSQILFDAQWQVLHSVYKGLVPHYKGREISVDIPRYVHTGRPLVRIGWYPRSEIDTDGGAKAKAIAVGAKTKVGAKAKAGAKTIVVGAKAIAVGAKTKVGARAKAKVGARTIVVGAKASVADDSDSDSDSDGANDRGIAMRSPETRPVEGSKLYMPVCRYEKFCHDTRLGICRGDNCRFFFYEPNSATMLEIDRARTAFYANKVAAFFALLREAPSGWQKPPAFDSDSWEARVYDTDGTVVAMHNTIPWHIYGQPRPGHYTDEYRSSLTRFVADFYEWHPASFRAEEVPTYSIKMRGPGTPAVVERIGATLASNAAPGATHDPESVHVTPLSPSFGDSPLYICGHANDTFDRAICAMARACGIDTVVLGAELGAKRATTEIVCTDANPYARLAWAATDVGHETLLATTETLARCERLCGSPQSRVMFSRPKAWIDFDTANDIDSDPTLATLWFPEDGLLLGPSLTKWVPHLSATGRIANV